MKLFVEVTYVEITCRSYICVLCPTTVVAEPYSGTIYISLIRNTREPHFLKFLFRKFLTFSILKYMPVTIYSKICLSIYFYLIHSLQQESVVLWDVLVRVSMSGGCISNSKNSTVVGKSLENRAWACSISIASRRGTVF